MCLVLILERVPDNNPELVVATIHVNHLPLVPLKGYLLFPHYLGISHRGHSTMQIAHTCMCTHPNSHHACVQMHFMLIDTKPVEILLVISDSLIHPVIV